MVFESEVAEQCKGCDRDECKLKQERLGYVRKLTEYSNVANCSEYKCETNESLIRIIIFSVSFTLSALELSPSRVEIPYLL